MTKLLGISTDSTQSKRRKKRKRQSSFFLSKARAQLQRLLTVESLEDRMLLHADPFYEASTASDMTLRVEGSALKLYEGGTLLNSAALSTIDGPVRILGSTGDDSLTIDVLNYSVAQDILFVGGLGADTVTIESFTSSKPASLSIDSEQIDLSASGRINTFGNVTLTALASDSPTVDSIGDLRNQTARININGDIVAGNVTLTSDVRRDIRVSGDTAVSLVSSSIASVNINGGSITTTPAGTGNLSISATTRGSVDATSNTFASNSFTESATISIGNLRASMPLRARWHREGSTWPRGRNPSDGWIAFMIGLFADEFGVKATQ